MREVSYSDLRQDPGAVRFTRPVRLRALSEEFSVGASEKTYTHDRFYDPCDPAVLAWPHLFEPVPEK